MIKKLTAETFAEIASNGLPDMVISSLFPSWLNADLDNSAAYDFAVNSTYAITKSLGTVLSIFAALDVASTFINRFLGIGSIKDPTITATEETVDILNKTKMKMLMEFNKTNLATVCRENSAYSRQFVQEYLRLTEEGVE